MTDKPQMYVVANCRHNPTSAIAFRVPQPDDPPYEHERLQSWCDACYLRPIYHEPDNTYHFHILRSPSPEEGGFRVLRANPGDYIVSEGGMLSAWDPDKFQRYFDPFSADIAIQYPRYADPEENEPHT